jgi:hypothetical protein
MSARSCQILIAAAMLLGTFCSAACANLYFAEDFESDLSAWTGKDGGAHHGTIVEDPLNPGNHALTFTERNSYGDIFTVATLAFGSGMDVTISFDYLGLVSETLDDGGFAGLSAGLPSEHMWYYGTNTTSHAAPVLVDDGQWHHYEYELTAPSAIGSGFHLMFEDYMGTGGDAFFDNIRVHAPLPGAVLLGAIGMGIAGWRLKWARS